MKKRVFAALLVAFSTMTAFPAYAAGWQKDPSGWKWQFEDETFAANGWYWLDGNNDQIEDCYYFDKYGYILRNTETPDGFQVNPDGSWVVDGVVQTRKAGETAEGVTAETAGTEDGQNTAKAAESAETEGQQTDGTQTEGQTEAAQ